MQPHSTMINLIITVIGLSIICEIIRLRLATLYDDTIQFLIAVFMIIYYFIFLIILLSRRVEPLFKLRSTLYALILFALLSFMVCSFVIANNNLEHVFVKYLNYVFASGYLFFSCTILSVLLESYLKQKVDEVAELEDEHYDDKKQIIYP